MSFDDSGDTMGDTWPCVDAADLETSITGETFGEWLFGSGTATLTGGHFLLPFCSFQSFDIILFFVLQPSLIKIIPQYAEY